MANINIAEWSPDQVVEWMSGLGSKLTPYIALFKEKGVDGNKLLTLRCDDLEYLGINIIGHQELLLEAVEHLRNFQYEVHRENLQQLAMRLSVAATSLFNELRTNQDGSKVETQTLSDVARVIAAVKPLVCWLDRSPFAEACALSERKSAVLKLSLEAATCAQRDRFAEHPTRAIAAAASALAKLADYIVQEVQDAMLLQPASLMAVSWQQGSKPLGLCVLPSFCGHHQVVDIRFGSPAHAAGRIQEGDEIVQVGDQPVVGWSGAAVGARCSAAAAARGGELTLAVRRRAAARVATRAQPLLRLPRMPHPRLPSYMLHPPRRPWEHTHLYEFKRELGLLRAGADAGTDAEADAGVDADAGTAGDTSATAASSSDESEPLSPPASPTHLAPDTRMYPPPPRTLAQRRNTISGGSPPAARHSLSLQQFWKELRNQKSFKHTGSAQMSNENGDIFDNLYRRDKSVSYSTGLEISPRPKTCLGVGSNQQSTANKKGNTNGDESESDLGHSPNKSRGKLDKSHSTPAYDFGGNNNEEPGSLVTQIIPESPSTPTDSPTILVHSAEKADQILDFKKYSSQIGEAILQQQHKHKLTDDKTKFTFTERIEAKVDNKDNEKVLETINIAMMEHQNRDEKKVTTRQSSFKLQTTFTENGQTTTTKTFLLSEHVKTIQNEIVQAINEQRTNTRQTIFKELPDSPPEPPPRPLSTQKSILKEAPLFAKDARIKDYPPLKAVKQLDVHDVKEYSPLKPLKHGETIQISLPLKHITKHDIHLIPNEKRELLPLNYDSNLNLSQMDISKSSSKSSNLNVLSNPDLVSSMNSSLSESQSLQRLDSSLTLSHVSKAPMSPPTSVVRNIFPSKSKSLKKKNSLLVKRRRVAAGDVCGVVWRGVVHQRVRGRAPPAPATAPAAGTWAKRLLLLRDDALLAYRDSNSAKADCLIFLNGFTVAAASEVKSKPFAFKVYHTGTAFYFAADSSEEQAAWIQHIGRATLNTDTYSHKGDESRNFSETDYSDGEHSDREGSEKKEKEKDKSKFGSLKKLTHRMHRSESQENVSHSSTSLDRKYLRFFYRTKNKDESKSSKEKAKHNAAPVPTEHYRSYRRVHPPHYAQTEQTHAAHNVAKIKKIDPILDSNPPNIAKTQNKIPKPINYIHASNPNLLDFEKSDFATKPSLQVPLPKPKVRKPDNLVGFITLEEFMLKEQEQERQQVYSNRVQMGIEKDKQEERASSKKAAKELQKQWERIIPDVIYGELPTYSEDQLPVPVVEQIQSRSLPKTPERQKKNESLEKNLPDGKPVSIKGKDGYEKIVYTVEKTPLKDPDTEPPKILPRKPVRSDMTSTDIARKSSLTSAKDLGYEVIYDEKESHSDSTSEKNVRRKSKDLGYEINYGTDRSKERRSSEDVPPKIMPKSKQVLNRQNSLNRNSGVETTPVFVQGESPEKFWLNSLRRNDRVHHKKANDDRSKALKSATQYTPMSLPLTGGAGLATAPHLQISLDAKDNATSPSRAGISRLRQMFGGGGSGSVGTGAGPMGTSTGSVGSGTGPLGTSMGSVGTGTGPLGTGPVGTGTGPRARITPQQDTQTDIEEGWCMRMSSPEYPHLQCPPTFQAETYSLLRRTDDNS